MIEPYQVRVQWLANCLLGQGSSPMTRLGGERRYILAVMAREEEGLKADKGERQCRGQWEAVGGRYISNRLGRCVSTFR